MRRRAPIPALVALLAALAAPSAAAQEGQPPRPATTSDDRGVVRVGEDGQSPEQFSVQLSKTTFDPAQGLVELETTTAPAEAQGAVTAAWGVIGRDDVFPDSLASGSLLGGAPLLYVPGGPEGAMGEDVESELLRTLDPGSTVYLAGGTDAVSADVESRTAELGFIPFRLGGADRIQTSVAIARETVRLQGAPERVCVASAANFPDAIAGGALAADDGSPLVLTAPDQLSESTTVFLDEFGDDAEVVFLGGSAAIADDVFEAADGDARIGGETRSHTAAMLAERWPDDRTGAALIEGYAEDAWVQGTAGATAIQPLLLTGPGPETLNQPTTDALAGRTGPLFVLGGTDRIAEAVADDADDAASAR